MMKLFKTVFLTVIIIAGFIYISGCDTATNSNSGTGVISGKILDSLSNVPVKDVTITTTPATYAVVTDSLGNFMITGLAGGEYALTAKKSYYFTRTYPVTVVDDDTIKPQFSIQFTQILTGTDLIVSEYMDDNSLSAMNIFTPGVIKENQNSEKDIQLRDSLGLSYNFFFRSGDLALRLAGLETKFMGPLTKANGDSIYTQAEFDNLNKIKLNGTISVSDFYEDRTNSFRASTDANPGLKKVYGLYLKGRGVTLPVYAMIYIKDGYFESGVFKVKVDVKVNRTGKDLFGPDQK